MRSPNLYFQTYTHVVPVTESSQVRLATCNPQHPLNMHIWAVYTISVDLFMVIQIACRVNAMTNSEVGKMLSFERQICEH